MLRYNKIKNKPVTLNRNDLVLNLQVAFSRRIAATLLDQLF